MIKVPLVKTDLPITTMTSTFYLPGDLFVLNVFGAKGGSELPDLKNMIIFAAIVGLIGYFFLRNKAFVAYYIAAAVGLYYFSVALFFIALGLSIVLIIKRHIDKSHVKWILIAAGIIIVLVLVVGAGLSFTRSMFGSMSQKSMNALEIADYADVERSNAPSMSMEKVGSGSGAIAVPTKKGVLPVKFQLPTLGKTITVRNDLITAEKQPSLSIWVISSYFVYLIYLGSLFAIFMCWKIYTSEKTETESKDKKK
jgi:hypothetical protein